MPDTLKVIRPNLEYSLTVNLSTTTQSQYGRVVVIMDKGFCTDAAGNRFLRTNHSSVFIHFGKSPNLMFYCFIEKDASFEL